MDKAMLKQEATKWRNWFHKGQKGWSVAQRNYLRRASEAEYPIDCYEFVRLLHNSGYV